MLINCDEHRMQDIDERSEESEPIQNGKPAEPLAAEVSNFLE